VAIAALAVVVLQLARNIWIFYQLAITDLEAAKFRPVATVSDNEVRVVRNRVS
jgi:hypothetical protein